MRTTSFLTNASICTTPSAHSPNPLDHVRRATHLVGYTIVCAIVTASFLATASTTVNARRLEAGLLKCGVDGGVAYVFGSTKNLHCAFYKSGGSTESYQGKIKKFGLDIGATGGKYIVWTVIAAKKQ